MNSATELDTRALLKTAYLEIKGLRSELARRAEAALEPVAVIGLGCRLPGGVVDADSLWALLRGGVDAVREVPADRWDLDSLFDPDPDAPGKLCTRHGSFLDEIGHFDSGLFGISPLEASSMDPQQRLLLEVAWEALENAGIGPESLRGSRTGVFVGMMYQDYLARQLRENGIEAIGPYLGTGSTFSAAAGRLSYVLGLQGPSLAVDTACSSSLVSLHLACQSLRNRECELALAGGVNAMLTPEATINLSKARMMSPSGRCRTFDAAADGYIRGEGCGLVVLKRLAQAQADGDRILGLIRGSAVNQDGRSNGLTAPNGSAQRALMREALAAARAEPEDIGYVECHGTGTPLGDPIEVGAILDVHGRRPADKPLAIGSAKTNFGHLESAAGICGFLKTLLVLRHKEIPPHLHLTRLNPHIRLEGRPVVIPTEPTPWFRQGQRMAAVSSFGFVGTNAHVILEAWEDKEAADGGGASRPADVLTLSAANAEALAALAGRYLEYLDMAEDVDLADLCHTAQVGRSHLAQRLALVAETVEDLREGLRQHLAGANPPGLFQGAARLEPKPRPAFLFTGQGSQYPGAGRGLYQSEPVFKAALDRCEALLRPYLERPLLAVLFAEPDSADAALLDQTAYTQPALFALEYALFELWTAWGVEPAVLLGHSVGEYAAACAAGVFSLEDGLKLIAARGALMQALPAGGGMAAIAASEAWAREALAAYPETLSLAAVNAPDEVTVSGRLEDLQAVLAQARQQGLQATELKVSHAFHSPLMRPLLEAFRAVLDGIRFQPPHKPLISNLSGKLVQGDEMGRADYWLEHVMAPVRFWQSVETLRERQETLLLEIGPRPTLANMACRILGEGRAAGVASLRAGQDESGQLAKALAGLYVRGVEIDWAARNRPFPRRKQTLPSYPFQRERHWLRPSPAMPPAAVRSSASAHLLGEPLPQPAHQPDTHVWQIDAGREQRGYLWDHQLMGRRVWPISAQLELALAAAREALGIERCQLAAFDFQHILYSLPSAEQQVQAVLVKTSAQTADFKLYSRAKSADAPEQSWVLHSRARIEGEAVPPVFQEPPAPAAYAVRDAGAAYAVQPATASARPPLQFSMMFFAATEETSAGDRYRLILEAARYADRAGFCSVWVPERHFTAMGSLYPNPAVLQAALARETRRIRLMAGSVVLPLHNPIHIAEEWAMVDNLSDGRVGLAVASGWNPADFVLAPDKYEDRYQHLYEGIATLRKLWRGESLNAKGVNGKEVSLRCYPTPVQAEIPLWMTAARSPESFRRAGEMGLNLLTHLLDQDIDILAEKIALYREGRARYGFDPAAGVVSVMCHTFLAADMDSVHRLARKPFCDYLKSSKPLLAGLAYSRSKDIDIDRLSEQELDDFVGFLYERFCGTRALIGTPASSLEMANRLHAAGVDEIACLLDFGPTTEQVIGHLPHLDQLRQDYAAQAPQAEPLPAVAGSVRASFAAPSRSRPSLEEVRARCGLPLPSEQFYRMLAGRGVVFEGSLQGIAKLGLGEGEALAEIHPDGRATGSYVIHPALLDACLQATLAALSGSAAQAEAGRIFVPTRVGALRVYQPVPHGPVWSHGWLAAQPLDGGMEGGLTVYAGDGSILFEVEGLQVKGIVPVLPADDMADWLYAVDWQEIPTEARPVDPGAWLLLEDGQGLGREWVGRQAACLQVLAGAATAATAAGRWTLNPRAADAFPLLLRHIDLDACPGVLCLWPCDSRLGASDDAAQLEAEQAAGVEAVIALAQALAATGRSRLPKLWIATRGAQAVAESQPVAVSQSPLWGLAAALARELPELWGGIVDLDPAASLEQAAADLRLAMGVAGEDLLAVRAGRIYAKRLRRAGHVPAAHSPAPIRRDGAYLIAGGLGGLSVSTASWLAGRGAGQIILLGRSPLPEAAALAPDDPRQAALATIQALREQGAKLSYVALDIGDGQQVADYLQAYAADSAALPIRGFFHAAGTYRDEGLAKLDRRALWEVLAAKLRGAWNMHRLLPDGLDCFVLFSSFSALTPPHGQGAYATACAFLDGLAWQRLSEGKAALSINWGAWSEVGFAASVAGREAHARLESMGMRRMTPAQALAMLERLLGDAATPPQIAVFPMDVGQMAQADPVLQRLPLLAGLGVDGDAASESAQAFLQALRQKDITEQRDFLLQDLSRIVAELLQLAPAKLKPDAPLTQLGLDSLVAVHLKNRLQRETGFDLPLVRLLDGASLAKLADDLMTEWRMGSLQGEGEASAEAEEEFEL